MPKILAFIIAVIITSTWLPAGPEAQDKSAETTAIQDRIDRRTHEIEMMNAYSARLQGILARNGFPSADLVRKLSFARKMDRVLPALHFDSTPFGEAIKTLSRTAQVKVSVDWKLLASVGVDEMALVTCDVRNRSAGGALDTVLEAVGGGTTKFGYALEDGAVKVTTLEEIDKHVLTKAYDVTALLPRGGTLQEAQDLVARLVIDTVSPDTWRDNGGTVGSLNFKGSQMIVTQTPGNLQAVETLLEQLDVRRQNVHSRETIDQQEIEIVALRAEIDRLTARCRSLGIRVPPRLDQAMELELPDVEFIGLPLSTCFESLAAASGQIINVNWEALKSAGIDSRAPIMLSLHNQTLAVALQSVMDMASQGHSPLEYGMEDNAIRVTAREEADKVTVTRVYDIREVPSSGRTREEAVERLMAAITTNFSPDSWRDAGGTTGNIRELQGMLIITQTERDQARIKAYLDHLRLRGR